MKKQSNSSKYILFIVGILLQILQKVQSQQTFIVLCQTLSNAQKASLSTQGTLIDSASLSIQTSDLNQNQVQIILVGALDSQSNFIDCPIVQTIQITASNTHVFTLNTNVVDQQGSLSDKNKYKLKTKDGLQITVSNSQSFSFLTEMEAGGGSVLSFSSINSVNIATLTLQSGTYDSGQALSLVDIPSITISKSVFSGLVAKTSEKGVIYMKNVNNVKITECQIKENVADDNGGGIFMDNVQNAEIEESQFIKNTVLKKGGAISFVEGGNISFKNVNFTDNSASDNQYGYGGSLFMAKSTQLLMEGILGQKNIANKEGGVAYIKNCGNIILRDLILDDNFCPYGPQSFLIVENDKVEVTDILVKNHNDLGGYTIYSHGGFTIENCKVAIIRRAVFDSNKSDGKECQSMVADLMEHLEITDSIFKNGQSYRYGGGICQDWNKYVLMRNITFENNYARSGGGAMLYQQDNMELYDIRFISNSANDGGGLILWQNSNVTLKNLYFYKNEAKIGGGLNIKNSVKEIYAQNITFIENKANNGGSIGMISNTDITLSNIKIINSTANQNGGGIYGENCNKLSLDNFSVNESKSQIGGAIYIKLFNIIKISNFKVTNNIAKIMGGGVYIFNGDDIQIYNGIFDTNEAQQTDGGGLYLYLNTIVSIKNITSMNNKAIQNGGGLYFESLKNYTIDTINVIDNQAFQGGGIFFNIGEDGVLNRLKCIGNKAEFTGGISLIKVDRLVVNAMTIKNNQGFSNIGGISLYITQNITMNQIDVNNNTAGINYGGVFIKYSNNIEIVDSNINQNIVPIDYVGGGVYIGESLLVYFKSVTLIENTAGEGAAIYLDYSQNLQLRVNNCTFQENQSYKSGGAIYAFEIKHLLVQNSIFRENSANQEGGAIKILNSKKISLQNSKFYNHRKCRIGCSIYSKDIDIIDIQGVQLFNSSSLDLGGSIYVQQIQQLKIQDSIISNSNVVNQGSMGGGIFIDQVSNLNFDKVNLVNCVANQKGGGIYVQNGKHVVINESKIQNNKVEYKQVSNFVKNSDYILSKGGGMYFELSDKTEFDILINSTEFINNCGSSGGSIYILSDTSTGQTKIKQNNLTFENNIADLGPALRLLGKDSTYNLFEDTNSKYNNNTSNLDEDNIFMRYFTNEYTISSDSLNFQLCQLGEFLTKGGLSTCDICPKNSVCEGGYIPIYPQKGYWRKNTKQQPTNFHYCNSELQNCKGNDTCSRGYNGLLCEQCDVQNGYANGNSVADKCLNCGSSFTIYFNIILTHLISLLVILYVIRGVDKNVINSLFSKFFSLISDYKVKDNTSQVKQLTKLMLTHFQLLSILIIVNLPSNVSILPNIIGNPTKSISQAMTCIQDVQKEDLKSFKFYEMLIGTGMITLNLLESFLVICILRLVNKTGYQNKFQPLLQSSILCFFLQIQPGLMDQLFSFLNCQEVDRKYYSFASGYLECNGTYYLSTVLPVVLSMLIVVAVIIPGIYLVLLKKQAQQNKLESFRNQRVYGYLYMNTKQQFYYWEFIVLVLKLAVVTSSNFLYTYGGIRSIVLVSIFCGYIILMVKFQPYSQHYMNTISIFMSIILCVIVLLQFIDSLPVSGNNTAFKVIVQLVIITSYVSLFSYIFKHVFPSMQRQFYNIVLQKPKVFPCLVKLVEHSIKINYVAKLKWKILSRGVKQLKQVRSYYVQNKNQDIMKNIYQKHFDDQGGIIDSVQVRDIVLQNFTESGALTKSQAIMNSSAYQKSNTINH